MNYRFECPLCESNKFKIIEKISTENNKLSKIMDNQYKFESYLKQNNYIYELRFCLNCGTRYQTFVLDEKESKDFYSQNIDPRKSLIKQVTFYKKNILLRKKTVKFIKNLLSVADKDREHEMLEIGAGWGFFSDISSQFNMRCTTLEISKERIDFHNLLNLNTISSFEEAYDKNLKFDIIYSNQVIEHISDLKSFFINCSNLLKKNGFLIAEYPSYNNLFHYIFKKDNYFDDMRTKALEHLQLISDKGVNEILEEFETLQNIDTFPIRKFGDRIKFFLQLITPSRYRGKGFMVVKKIK